MSQRVLLVEEDPALRQTLRDALVVDLAAHRVSLAGTVVHLTPTEFKLLARLVRSTGQVVTHRQLLGDAWGAQFTEHAQYLQLYMGQLRAKLELDSADPQHLLTEPGVGYRLVDADECHLAARYQLQVAAGYFLGALFQVF